MVQLRSREDVEKWLNARPKATRQADAVALSARAALRVLPNVFDQSYVGEKWFWPLTTVTFRAIAAARLFALVPSRAAKDAAASADSAAFSAAFSADSAAFSADSAARSAARSAALSAAASAARSAARSAALSAAASAASADSAAWEAISGDAEAIERVGAKAALLTPLPFLIWEYNGETDGTHGNWQAMKRHLLTQPLGDWKIWVDWYERIIRGEQSSKEVDQAYVLLDDMSLWDKGHEAANAAIKKKLEEVEKKPKPPKLKDRDFFISYNTKDELYAKEVNDLLETAGFTTVVQYRDFQNSNFISEMNKGLARTKRMVSLLTENYVSSTACEAEWNYFFNLDRTSNSRLIVHLHFEEAELLPLQQQIVYKNLIGKSRTERRELILEAVTHKPKTYSVTEAKAALAESASPDIQITPDNLLTAVPNAKLDKPRKSSEIEKIIDALLTFTEALLDSLSDQAPRATRETLPKYRTHLSENRSKSTVGLLSGLALAVQASKRDALPEDWGNGVLSLLSSFEEYHQRFISFYDKKSERDRLHSEIGLDQNQADGDALSRPVREVTKAINDYDGPITDELKAAFSDLNKAVQTISDVQAATPEDAGLVTPKKAIALTFFGSLERFYNLAGSTASIVSTPQGQAFIAALEKALSQLGRFIL